MSDSIQRTIAKYKYNPSILLIQTRIPNKCNFPFLAVIKTDIEEEIKNINSKKATIKKNISPGMGNKTESRSLVYFFYIGVWTMPS